MDAALLLAEPEPGIRGYLERQLASDGFHVLKACFNGEALELVERSRPDLVLLSELELCSRLRAGEPGRSWNRDVPVIVVGPSGADAVDRVRAFQRGADDYVPRPVVYEELLARIRAVLRRAVPPAVQRYEAGDLVVDRVTRSVEVRGESIHLAAKEFELLWRLAAEPHRVFTKEELLRDVWGYRSLCRTRTLDSHVCRLRRKLDRSPDDHFVVNVWGVGRGVVGGGAKCPEVAWRAGLRPADCRERLAHLEPFPGVWARIGHYWSSERTASRRTSRTRPQRS